MGDYWCLNCGTVGSTPCPRCGALAPFQGTFDFSRNAIPVYAIRQGKESRQGIKPFSEDAAHRLGPAQLTTRGMRRKP